MQLEIKCTIHIGISLSLYKYHHPPGWAYGRKKWLQLKYIMLHRAIPTARKFCFLACFLNSVWRKTRHLCSCAEQSTKLEYTCNYVYLHT